MNLKFYERTEKVNAIYPHSYHSYSDQSGGIIICGYINFSETFGKDTLHLYIIWYSVWALFGTVRYLLPVCRYFEFFNTLYFEWTWNFSSHISPILLNIMTLYLVSSSAVMTCNMCALFGSVRLHRPKNYMSPNFRWWDIKINTILRLC
jgi:hypothetical protein